MALALALAAGAGDLPETPPLVLDDPFTEPPAPLRWRRTGPRAGVLSSVGVNEVDDCGLDERDADSGKPLDLILRVTLPGR